MVKKILELKNEVKYQNDSVVSKLISASNGGTITLFAFSKGQKLSEHSAPFDAMVQVLEGNGETVISGEKFSLIEGQTIIMPKNEPHAVNALTDFKMLLTMIK